MQNSKKTVYIPVELEIIRLKDNDIIATSGGSTGPIPGSGHEDDPNVDLDW